MDTQLRDRLLNWHNQIEKVRATERQALQLEASEKSFYSELYLRAEGSSNPAKEAWVYSQEEWKNFSKGLAEAKSNLNHEKRKLELSQAAYQAEYLACKQEGEAVQKWPKGA